MLCPSCSEPASGLCEVCADGLARAPRRFISHDGVTVEVWPVFAHRGPAIRLVHGLKYRRSAVAGRLLAQEMARLIPLGATALVPVPRVFTRRAMYGIDQTSVLADAVSDIVRLPVMRDLAAGLWTPRSAGRQRSTRVAPAFRSLRPVAGCPVLIDDVCTTGKTLAGAALALGYERIPALVATAAGSMEGEVDDSGTRRWRDQNTGVR